MTMTDPIADMLTRIRNASQAYHNETRMPASKLKAALADLLQKQGYIDGYRPKGTLERVFPERITIQRDDGTLVVTRSDDERESRALHGLTRALLANMVTGVSDGFTRTLEIVGVGYRASLKGDDLEILVGYS